MYCRYCYRMIEDGAETCPACGKSQKVKAIHSIAKQIATFIKYSVIFTLLWIGYTFIAVILANILGMPETTGAVSTIFALSVVLLPILFAALTITKLIKKSSASARPKAHGRSIVTKSTHEDNPDDITHPASSVPPQVTPPVVAPDYLPEPSTTTVEDAKPTVDDEKVNIILESLRQNRFHETMRELFGEDTSNSVESESSAHDSSPSHNDPAQDFTDRISDYKLKTYRATGMSHHIVEILNLAIENDDFDMSKKEIIELGMEDEQIWEYFFCPSKVELVPEPDNPYDQNAIKVIVDGQHVAYIKAGSCAHLLKVINENGILGISCEMGGGKYKRVTLEIDEDTFEEKYILERSSAPYFVHLKIKEAISK